MKKLILFLFLQYMFNIHLYIYKFSEQVVFFDKFNLTLIYASSFIFEYMIFNLTKKYVTKYDISNIFFIDEQWLKPIFLIFNTNLYYMNIFKSMN